MNKTLVTVLLFSFLGCAQKSYRTATPDSIPPNLELSGPYAGMFRIDHPDCAEPVWIHPGHADVVSHRSWRASGVLRATNPRPGVYADVDIVSGSRQDSYRLYKNIKTNRGGGRKVVGHLCPGATIFLYEDLRGYEYASAYFEASGAIGVKTYTNQSPHLNLNAWRSWYSGSEVQSWMINLVPTPLMSPPPQYQSSTEYVDQNGVIRPK